MTTPPTPQTPHAPQAREPRHAGGRRPGETRTRAGILDAARECFAERGYDGTSLRRIAELAGVDQSLVNHFYGTKEKLFLVALEVPLQLSGAVAGAVPGDPAGRGERIVRAHLSIWDDLSCRPALMTMFRSAFVHEAAGGLLRAYATEAIREALGDVITGEDAEVRSALVAASLIGLSMSRYLLPLAPLASASAAEVVARLGPAVQTYLDRP